jgi:extradiol dioxygenase
MTAITASPSIPARRTACPIWAGNWPVTTTWPRRPTTSAVPATPSLKAARHEFFYGQLSLPGQFQPGRPLSGFVTGEQGMGHVVCVVPDLAAATRFYKMLGFKKSDEIYAFIDAHFFHCNPRHHTLAITEIPRVRGLHHIMIQLQSLDDVGLAYDLVQSRNIPLTMTLGRHPNDQMVSFYVRSPSGFEIEYGWGALEVGEDWTVTQYDAVSVWGHKMVGTSPPAALEEVL